MSLKLIFIVPFNFYSISIFFLIRGGGCHWQGTASGPKSHIGRSENDIGRAEKSHKGQNVTLECYIIQYVKPTAQLVFKNRFPKGGATCRRQVVNPRHQTSQGQSVAKPENPLQNIQVE